MGSDTLLRQAIYQFATITITFCLLTALATNSIIFGMMNFALLFFVSLAFAAPDVRKSKLLSWGEAPPKPTYVIQKKLDETKDLDLLGIIVEKSTISDVQTLLGMAVISKSGDAGTFLTSVCFLGADGTAIKFNSNEMGGSNFTITDIEVSDSLAESSKCLSSKLVSRSLMNKRGIKLGIPKMQVEKILGLPSVKIGINDWRYAYSSKLKDKKCQGGYDILETYRIKFAAEKVKYFSISKVTSC